MEYINIKEKYKKEDLVKLSKKIIMGDVGIIPTDTVYGLACDAFNIKGVERIYNIKKRDLAKPMSILVSDIHLIKKVTKNVSKLEKDIINKFLPGALTIVLEKNDKIPNIVTSGKDTVGIRMPNNKFILQLIDMVGHPIVATSLNLAGKPALTELENIPKEIIDNIDFIVDEGKAKLRHSIYCYKSRK